jgi:hypothetical protein
MIKITPNTPCVTRPLDSQHSSMTLALVMGGASLKRTKLTTGLAVGAVVAVVGAVAGGQGGTAFGASSPSLTKAQAVAVEQSASALAAQALGIGIGEDLVVKDVIKDKRRLDPCALQPDRSTGCASSVATW